MATPFADPQNTANPAFSLFSAMREPVLRGVPDPSTRHDFSPMGETMTDTADVLKRTAISSQGEDLRTIKSKIPAAGTMSFDVVDTGDYWFWLTSFFGGAQSPDLLETGCYLHRLAAYRTPDVGFAPTNSILAYRDDGMGMRFLDSVLSQLEISFGAAALTSSVLTFVSRAGDFWDDPSQTAGTGTAKLPMLRGVVDLNFGKGAYLTDASANVWVKVTAVTSTTVTVKTKIGDATSYGSGTQLLERGKFNWPILDETGARIGSNAKRVELYFPATGSIVVNDEYEFLRRRDAWTAVLVDGSTVVREIDCRLIISDTGDDPDEVEVKSGKITLVNPSQAIQAFGFGDRAKRTRSRGLRTGVLTLAREYLDLDFRRRMELGATISYRISLNSMVGLGTTGTYQHSIDIIAPLCEMSGPGATVTNQTTVDEAITLTAHPSSDGTYPHAVTADFVTDIPDLAAA